MSDQLTPWQSLAQQARRLAEAAERVGALGPSERIGAGVDELDLLDERALAVRSVVGACRRDTYEQLREGGWTPADLAAAVGTSPRAVYKILARAAADKPAPPYTGRPEPSDAQLGDHVHDDAHGRST